MMPANSALQTSRAPTGVAVTRVPGAGGRRSWLEWILSTVADRGRPFAPVPAAGVLPLERARLLAFCQQQQELLRGKVVVFRPVEQWNVDQRLVSEIRKK